SWQPACLGGRVLEAGRDEPLVLHPSKRDVDGAALQAAFGGVDEFQAVPLTPAGEQLENERFLRRQAWQPALARHHSDLTYCKTGVNRDGRLRLSARDHRLPSQARRNRAPLRSVEREPATVVAKEIAGGPARLHQS